LYVSVRWSRFVQDISRRSLGRMGRIVDILGACGTVQWRVPMLWWYVWRFGGMRERRKVGSGKVAVF
jgi:hypothetical protein